MFFVPSSVPPQMEILEMLAMSGADLENKNKNDETPSGKYTTLLSICDAFRAFHCDNFNYNI